MNEADYEAALSRLGLGPEDAVADRRQKARLLLAAHAISGMQANPEYGGSDEICARDAIAIADAVIKELGL